MEFFFSDQTAAVFCCLLAGVFMGVVYDLFLIKRRVFGGNRVTLCIEDALFCVISFIMLMLFVLKANYGQMRWYEVVLPYPGFVIYRKSIGRVTVNFGAFIIGKIIFLGRMLFGAFVLVPAKFTVKMLGKFRVKAVKCFCFMRMKGYTDRKKRSFVRSAGRGFKI